MKAHNKQVVSKLQQHILEGFDPRDFDIETPLQALKLQIEYMKHDHETDYDAGTRYVEGGGYLVYHGEVQEFLNGLGINPDGKEYDEQDSWRLYVHLLAREISELVK